MIDGGQVAGLWGFLGLRVDKSAWAQGHQQINSLRTALMGAAAYMGGGMLGKALLGFSSSAEQGVLQLKAMLALARHTDVADQAKDAEKMYASLQKRAAQLPGTLEEYIGMAGKITRVAIDAGLSIQELEDMTVNAVVAAKGLGEQWEVAARDIEQAIMGRFNTTDPFSSKVLGAMGYKGEAGREKYKGKTEKERAKEFAKALGSKQFVQLGEESGKTLEGRWDQFKEAIKQTFGVVGKPLFEQTKGLLEDISKWTDKNQKQIAEVAKTVGGALKDAFSALGAAVVSTYEFLTSGTEKSKIALTALAGVGVTLLIPTIKRIAGVVRAAFGPWGLLIAGVSVALVKLAEHLGFDGPLEMLVAAWKKIEEPVMSVIGAISTGLREAISLVHDFASALISTGEKIGKSKWFDRFMEIASKGISQERITEEHENTARNQRRQWNQESRDAANAADSARWREQAMRDLGYMPSVPVAGATNSTINSHNTTTVSVVVHEATNAKETANEVEKRLARKLADGRPGMKR